MYLYFSPGVRQKLSEVHEVEEIEVEEAFWLHAGGPYFVDDRDKNQTIPPTMWFVGRTAEGRVLKVVFIYDLESDTAIIKTVYEPDDKEIELYETNARPKR